MIVGNAEDRSLWPSTELTRVLLTDPPFGLNKSWRKSWHGGNGKSTLRDGTVPDWDKEPPRRVLLDALVEWADVAVIWGGNYFHLPPSPCWMVWDKMQSNRGSDAEMAWTNAPVKGVKVFRMSRIDAYYNKRVFPKVHVAEKPVQLMAWCLGHLKLETALVFDPFAGCGSSLVAAKSLGLEHFGLDVNERYVAEAQRRLNETEGGVLGKAKVAPPSVAGETI